MPENSGKPAGQMQAAPPYVPRDPVRNSNSTKNYGVKEGSEPGYYYYDSSTPLNNTSSKNRTFVDPLDSTSYEKQKTYYAHTPEGAPKASPDSSRFNGVEWHDLWASIIFILTVLAFFGLGIFGLAKLQINWSFVNSGSSTVPTTDFWNPRSLVGFIVIGLVSLGIAFCGSMTYMVLLYHFPRFMIYFTFVFTICLYVALAIFMFVKGSIVGGILMCVLLLFFALFFFFTRNRIAFAAEIIRTVMSIAGNYKAMFVAAIFTLVVLSGFTAFWVFSTMGLAQYWANSTGSYIAAFVFNLFVFYWFAQVTKNVLHTTCAGVFASHYMLASTSDMFKHPTLHSARNALTYSFGSVCFGSLLVAVIQFVRAIVRIFVEGSFLSICADCLLGCMEGILRFFNTYAYTYIAMYGRSYCNSARSTWHLIKRAGLEVIINDNIVSIVLSAGCFLIGTICATVAGLWAWIAFNDQKAAFLAIMIFAGLVIGFSLTAIMLEVVEAGVASTLVVLAEDHAAVQRVEPRLFKQFIDTYGQKISFH